MWLEPTQSTGIGFRYFTIEDEENFNVSSDGDPILGRPFFDTVTGSGAALLVAFPGVNSGSIDVTATNEARGFDVYFRKLLLSGNCNRFDLIGGYHNSTVEDTVNIATQSRASMEHEFLSTRPLRHRTTSLSKTSSMVASLAYWRKLATEHLVGP